MLPPGSGMVTAAGDLCIRNYWKIRYLFDLRSTKCRYHVAILNFRVPGGTPGFRSSWLLLAARVVFGLLHDVARHRQVAELRGALATFPDPLGLSGAGCRSCWPFFRGGRLRGGCVAGLFYRLALIPMVLYDVCGFLCGTRRRSLCRTELALVYLVVFVLMYAAGPGRIRRRYAHCTTDPCAEALAPVLAEGGED